MDCRFATGAALGFPVLYLLLVRLCDFGGTNRNEERSIKKRALGASIATLISAIVSFILLSHYQTEPLRLMGLHTSGLISSTFIPFFLTVTLFLGSTVLEIANGSFNYYFRKSFWIESFQDWRFIRNCAIAPITEEIAFRICVVPLLRQCFTKRWIIILCPLPFSLAHFHHMLEKWPRVGFLMAFLESAFQATYTYIFGIYATYLFVITGHAASPIIAHIYCNFMGFPPLDEIFQQPKLLTRLFYMSVYCLGLFMFIIGLKYASVSSLFHNNLY